MDRQCLRGAYYVEDATGAVAIKGITLTAGKALNGYIVGTKSDDTSVDMDGVVVEYGLTADDATTFEATDVALEGTVMAISAVGTQANYGKLITVENVIITGSGQNKTLTDADGNKLLVVTDEFDSLFRILYQGEDSGKPVQFCAMSTPTGSGST